MTRFKEEICKTRIEDVHDRTTHRMHVIVTAQTTLHNNDYAAEEVQHPAGHAETRIRLTKVLHGQTITHQRHRCRASRHMEPTHRHMTTSQPQCHVSLAM